MIWHLGDGADGGLIVHHHCGHAHRAGQLRCNASLGDDNYRTGVRQHERDPLCRICRIYRQERRSRLQHRQLGDHDVRRTGQREGDNPLRPRPTGDQRMGQPVRPGVHVSVAERIAIDQNRRQIWRPRDLSLEQLRQRGAGHLVSRVIPLREQPGPFGFRQDVYLPGPDIRVRGDRADHPDQMGRQLLSSDCAEHTLTALDDAGQSRLSGMQTHRDVSGRRNSRVPVHHDGTRQLPAEAQLPGEELEGDR
jgi:hypothetical protein